MTDSTPRDELTSSRDLGSSDFTDSIRSDRDAAYAKNNRETMWLGGIGLGIMLVIIVALYFSGNLSNFVSKPEDRQWKPQPTVNW